ESQAAARCGEPHAGGNGPARPGQGGVRVGRPDTRIRAAYGEDLFVVELSGARLGGVGSRAETRSYLDESRAEGRREKPRDSETAARLETRLRPCAGDGGV